MDDYCTIFYECYRCETYQGKYGAVDEEDALRTMADLYSVGCLTCGANQLILWSDKPRAD